MNIIVVGASGFGRELLQYVQDAHRNTPDVRLKGFLDDDPTRLAAVGKALTVGIIGDTRTYEIREDDRFIVSLGDPALRRVLADRLSRRGARFVSVIHPTAYVAPTARLGCGCVIGPFANVGSHVQLEDHVLLNLYSAAGHDARVGAFSVFSPYSVANGGSTLGAGVFLGTHAAISANVRVGAGSRIAAGAVAYREVPEQCLAVGNPAKAFPLEQPGSSRQGPRPVAPEEAFSKDFH